MFGWRLKNLMGPSSNPSGYRAMSRMRSSTTLHEADSNWMHSLLWVATLSTQSRPRFSIKTVFPGMGISHYKDKTIFIMEIPILVRRPPWSFSILYRLNWNVFISVYLTSQAMVIFLTGLNQWVRVYYAWFNCRQTAKRDMSFVRDIHNKMPYRARTGSE